MQSTRYYCQSVMKLEFSRQTLKKFTISSFIKTRQVGVELFPSDRETDGRTDVKLIVAFRNFANARKNGGK